MVSKKTGKSTRMRRSATKKPEKKKEEIKPKEEKMLDWVEDKVALPPEPKPAMKLKPVKVFLGYFVKYIGKHKHMSLSPGIGKVVPGKWYKVDENIFNALKQTDHWLAVKRYKDVDATKIKRR